MDAQTYITAFKTSPAWAEMCATVEASPWHREANVAVHTEMVIDQYLQRFAPIRTPHQNTIALMALLFHDVGKPSAEETLEKKDGTGNYRRYAGHEQQSAVAFTERWLCDKELQAMLTPTDARAIRWIIEHHLPYGLKDGAKRSALRTAVVRTLDGYDQTFYDVLRSDAAGRISDDHATKLQNVEDWIREFRTVPYQMNRIDTSMGKCFVLIGPSGSGKSTWTKANKRGGDPVVSQDDFRFGFFDLEKQHRVADSKQLYRDVWAFCAEHDKEFNAFMQSRTRAIFSDLRITRCSAFIDTVNSSKKTRARYVQEARNLGMEVVAVEFWNTTKELLARQKTRTDKEVPYYSVIKQQDAQTCAWLGSEVDDVMIVFGRSF